MKKSAHWNKQAEMLEKAGLTDLAKVAGKKAYRTEQFETDVKRLAERLKMLSGAVETIYAQDTDASAEEVGRKISNEINDVMQTIKTYYLTDLIFTGKIVDNVVAE